MKNNSMVITVLVAIIVAAVGFFAGMRYQQSKVPGMMGGQQQFGRGTGEFGQNQRFGGRGNSMRPVTGEILSVDANSVTVKLQDGSSKIVNVSDTTQINKADKATVADLKAGETIAAFGTTNSDGSVTAQNIQLNPQTRMMGTNGQATPTPEK